MRAEESKAMAEKLFVGGSELGALLRSHDWSQTPLGAVETWSENLKTAVQNRLAELNQAQRPEPVQQASVRGLQNCTQTATLRQAAHADAFRVTLFNALRLLTDANEIQATAARILGEHLGVSRVIYAEVLPGGKDVIVHKNYTNGVAELSGQYCLDDFGRNLTDDHRAGQTVIVPDVANSLKYTDSEKAMYRAIDIAAHLDVPLIKKDQFVALLAVHQSTPREWTQREVRWVEETAAQTWATVERARAEAALRESEAHYRTLFELIDEGFCTIEVLFDADGKPFDHRILQANPAFKRQSGIANPVGKRASELAPGLEQYWNDLYAQVIQTGESIRTQERSDALDRWFEVLVSRVGDVAMRQVAIVFTDISSRKQAETALLQSEAQSKNILESITDGFFALDQNWRFTYVNPQAERILDRTPGDLLGKVIWEEYPGTIGMEFERAYCQTARERVVSSLTSFYPDHNCWYEAHAYPATDGITVYFRNVTEQVQAEAALRESEEKTRNILESIAEAFFTLDQDWRFTYMNRAAEVLLDRTPGDLIGKNFWEEYPGAVGNELAAIYHGAMHDRVPGTLTTFYPDHDCWYYVRTYPAANGIAVYFNNVTVQIQAETALRESEERFRSMADNAPMMVWVTDSTGYCTYLSQSWYDFTGQTEETGLGVGWLNAIHPEDLEDSKAIFLTANERYEAFQLEYRLRCKDGEYRWAIDAASPWFGVDGQFKGFIGSVIDISDRKQAEETLRESEQRFRLMADAVPQIVWITDAQGRVEFFNKQWSDYTGVPYEQTTAAEVAASFVHPEDGDRTMGAFNAARRSGGTFSVEHRIRSATGSYRWFLVRAEPYRDPQTGEIVRWFGASINIHDRKQAEEALRESETRLRVMLDASQIGEWDLDLTTEPHIAHRSLRHDQIFGYESLLPEWSYEIFLAHVHPDDRAAVNEKFQETLSASANWNFECRVIHPDQSIHWIWARSSVYCDFCATPTRLLGMVVDITDRKQVLEREQAAREEAERANRIKDEFLAVLSHELRSPLNPILGWTQLLQKGKLDEARRAEALKTIERNAKLQTQLIEDLLDISGIMQGKLSLTAAPVSLTFVISAAIETVRLAAEAKHIRLQLDLDNTVAPISGDVARLQQVVWNLLSNAVKFTPNGGQVTVELRQLNQLAQIRVIDTGKGINPQFLPYMFEYFRQEDGSTTRKFGGLGLGLAIARQIVEMHGGTVRANSQGEGQGATFIVQLPAMKQTDTIVSEPIGTKTDAGLPLSGIQILLVDDEPDTREFQAFLLGQNGAHVRAVASGEEALQALEQSIPDVLVSDIGMADMDGYMLLQQIRSHEALRSDSRSPNPGGMIPAIALTAYAAEIDRQQALQVGFQTHITKPVEPSVGASQL